MASQRVSRDSRQCGEPVAGGSMVSHAMRAASRPKCRLRHTQVALPGTSVVDGGDERRGLQQTLHLSAWCGGPSSGRPAAVTHAAAFEGYGGAAGGVRKQVVPGCLHRLVGEQFGSGGGTQAGGHQRL